MDNRSLERALFAASLELPRKRRASFVRDRCGDDSALADRIHRLLAAHDRADALTSRIDTAVRAIGDPDQIGPYRILERIGEGGMGVVYLAEQKEPIRRRVALKLIKIGMDTDEVLARFESERQAMALMNHSGIASLLDAGATESGRPYFVMEAVPGLPISEYCDRERLGLAARLRLFLDVCAAVQHAHQRGVIHRDLKPSNLLVAEQDGQAVCKIIDFGIAKATSQKLTDRTLHTQLGGLVGTPEYMSPEQVDGVHQDVDTRADIYSLGVVLFELMVGGRPFELQGTGKDLVEIRRTIMEEVPESPSERAARLAALVPAVAMRRDTTPASLVRALRGDLDWIVSTTLAKEPRRRYQTARELAEDIRRYLDDRPLKDRPRRLLYRGRKFVRRHRRAVAGAAVLAVVGALGAWTFSGEYGARIGRLLTSEPAPRRVGIAVSEEEPLWLGATRSLAIARSGERVAYVGQAEGDTHLYVRRLDRWEASRLRGTRGARMPFFSPDGQWLGFFARGTIYRLRADGSSAPEVVTELGLLPRGASWSDDDRIAYSVGPRGIYAVPAGGGEPERLTEPDAGDGELEHQWPHWLPGGRSMLLAVTHVDGTGTAERIEALDLETERRHVVLEAGGQPAYVETGHLVHAVDGALAVVRFDVDRLAASGASVAAAEAVRSYPAAYSEGATYFDVSRDGSLLLVPPASGDAIRLDWLDREGRVLDRVEVPGVPGWPRISPDGRYAAIHVGDASGRDVWLLDLQRPGSLRQLTSRGGGFPVWSADGRRIAFTSRRGGANDIYVVEVDGSDEPRSLVTGERTQIPVSWSSSQVLAYYEVAGDTQRDLWTVAAGAEPEPFTASAANELGAAFSPDGTALAYVSNETGRNEVYVRRYPAPGAVIVVSIEGGSEPVWNAAGDRLYYRNGQTVMTVPIQTRPELRAQAPAPLFTGNLVRNSAGNASFDITPDGRRFLMLRSGETTSTARLRVVLGWDAELRRLGDGEAR